MTELQEPLSERQLEILAYLSEGLTNREIASRLYLSLAGVKWNNSEIYSKLGVNNRDDAVAHAQQLGLLNDESNTPQPIGKHNLPQSVTEFVGRKTEIREVIQLVEDKRLVTILAPGGMGKTRLSLAVARIQIGQYSDGVYFVPLAPLSSPDDIVTTVAENIGFVFHGENPLVQQLVNFLKDRVMFLVLDNFEHVLDGAGLVSDIIKSTPNIKIIITSRERLNLRGETVYNLRGLEFPTWETPHDAMAYDAVKLFMRSANRARTDFTLHNDDLDYLSRICRLTAGMPLGIELAAGWMDVLSLEQIASEIQQGIDILETDMRDMPERHRSLRATFEQTWVRLTNDEQKVFARLSVFRGGFTLESAEAVTDANARHLRKLAQKALIQIEANERYAIHELLRQFGEGKLAKTDELSIIQAKHAQYFADFMTARKSEIKGNSELTALHLIEYDFENVHVAWLYCVKCQEWEQLPKFLFSLYWYCDACALDHIVIQMIKNAIQMLQSGDQSVSRDLTLATVTVYICWFYKNQNLLDMVHALCNDAIPILEREVNTEVLIFAYNCLATTCSMEGHHEEAIAILEVGYKLAKESDDTYWQGRLLVLEARMVSFRDHEESLDILNHAQSILEKLDNRIELSNVYDARSFIMYRAGNNQQAKENLLQRRQLIVPFQMPFSDADDLLGLATLAMREGDFISARSHIYQSLDIFWNAGYMLFAQNALFRIAQLYFYEGKFEDSLEILANLYASPMRHTTDSPNLMPDISFDILRDNLKSALEQVQYNAIWEQSQKQELNEFVVSLLAELKSS